MNQISKIEHQGQRVLTTQQLAEFYEVEPLKIQQNYANNKNRYSENTHFFTIHHGVEGYSKFSNSPYQNQPIYLWTERGAFNHAKSLGSDKAWEVYNMLVDTYYRVKDEKMMAIPQDYPSALRALADQVEANQKLLPKAESFDSLMNAEGNLSIKEASEILNYKGLGRNNLFKVLRDEKIIFGNYVYQEHIDAGRFIVKVITIDMGDKSEPRSQIFVTPKGLEWLDKYLQKHGYEKALSEVRK